MTLDLTATGIRFENVDGIEPFSTDIEMLHVLDERSGSLSFPFEAGAYSTHTQKNVAHTLATDVDPAATHVIGAARIEWSGLSQTASVAASKWWMWNGTFVVFFELGQVNTAGSSFAGLLFGNTREELASWTDLTPRVSGGNLYVDERTYIRGNISAPIYGPFQRQGFTLHWKLKTCIFS